MTDPQVRIVLVRHGRTALNAEDRLRGLADPELDAAGIAQAQAVAQALVPLRIGLVLSSPLRRAVATAQEIARASGVAHRADPAFNDRDYGPWTGQVRGEVIRRFGSVDDAPGVEDSELVCERALAGLDRLAREGSTAPTAVVTHDAVIRPVLRSIRADIEPEVPTCSWAILTHGEEAGWQVTSYDNTVPTP